MVCDSTRVRLVPSFLRDMRSLWQSVKNMSNLLQGGKCTAPSALERGWASHALGGAFVACCNKKLVTGPLLVKGGNAGPRPCPNPALRNHPNSQKVQRLPRALQPLRPSETKGRETPSAHALHVGDFVSLRSRVRVRRRALAPPAEQPRQAEGHVT